MKSGGGYLSASKKDGNEKRSVRYTTLGLILLSMSLTACQRAAQPVQFRITMPKSLHADPIDGRMLLIISKDPSREPRFQATNNALMSQQIFGVNVDGLAPDGSIVIDSNAAGAPLDRLAQVPASGYYVQALLNVYETFHRADGHILKLPPDRWEGQKWNLKPGNLYSTPRQVWVDPAAGGTIDITLDKEIPPLPYPTDTKYVKYVRIQSKLLTAFWGRPMYLGSFVLLPDGWDTHPNTHYPLVVNPAHFETGISLFSETPPDPTLKGDLGSEYPLQGDAAVMAYKFYEDWKSGKLPRMLVMTIQHPNPYYDDSYGVNSANIGPYGDAITRELIPYIEQKFRGIGQPWARVLTGCSTGGWEALGMQVLFPDFYNGTWAGAPSQIEFHSTRLVNIYSNKNAYYDEGPFGRVPIASFGNPMASNSYSSLGYNSMFPSDRMEDGQISTTMEQDNHFELVIGDHGRGAGLWDAMQAVWAPVGPDGYPAPLWNKLTGEINPDVVKYEHDHYDLGNILQRDWPTIGPKLAGKIHIQVGTHDQFYLANAVRRVDKILQATKNPYYDGTVEYGDRFVHCYQGDPTVPESISGRMVYERQMPVMADRMLKTAPSGADVKSWRY